MTTTDHNAVMSRRKLIGAEAPLGAGATLARLRISHGASHALVDATKRSLGQAAISERT